MSNKLAKFDSAWEKKLGKVEALLSELNISISVKEITIDNVEFNLTTSEIGSSYNPHTEDIPRWSDDIRLYLKETKDD